MATAPNYIIDSDLIYCRLIVHNNLQKFPQAERWPHSLNESHVALISLVKQESTQSYLIRGADKNFRLHVVAPEKPSFELLLCCWVVLYSRCDLVLAVVTNAHI